MIRQIKELEEHRDFLVLELNARTDPVKEHSPYNLALLKELKALNRIINYLLSK